VLFWRAVAFVLGLAAAGGWITALRMFWLAIDLERQLDNAQDELRWAQHGERV
jgi:hypothetical protein